ncbi:uncharacterized protein [Lolium perenne]|uniref:uncharacterized protein n=1 Tax=Lolium perenne TaxID=4522 RepID=UPI003A9A1401
MSPGNTKEALQNAPVLAAPLPQETMLVYVTSSNHVVSAVMVVECKEEGKEQLAQCPVYYSSEALTKWKQRYSQYQKLIYSLFRALQRLAPYFHEHPIKNCQVAVELGGHNITYEPRHAVQSQVLADFFVDWEEVQQRTSPADFKNWTLYFYVSKNLEGAGAGIVLISPKGDTMRYVMQLQFEPCTNNVAEYGVILHGMRITKEMGASRMRCFGDSDLVAS